MLRDILSASTLALHTPQISAQYQNAKDFPNILIENFLKDDAANATLGEFPAVDDKLWINYLHYNEKKYGLNKRDALPPGIRGLIDTLNSDEFVSFLSDLTGIKGLVADPDLEGGGLHQIPPGGFFENIHADFQSHPHKPNWRRRVNVLVYMNKDWPEEYGGHVELWTRDMKTLFRKSLPLFNRCLIFNTDPDAYHGHPDPLKCPSGRTRKSIALYYFTVEKAPLSKRITNYKARPGDSAIKALLIYADKKALAFYSRMKSLFGINDDAVSKILRFLSRKK